MQERIPSVFIWYLKSSMLTVSRNINSYHIKKIPVCCGRILFKPFVYDEFSKLLSISWVVSISYNPITLTLSLEPISLGHSKMIGSHDLFG